MEKHQIDKKMGPQKLHKTSEVEFSSRKNLANVHFQEDTLSVFVNFCSIFLDKKATKSLKTNIVEEGKHPWKKSAKAERKYEFFEEWDVCKL